MSADLMLTAFRRMSCDDLQGGAVDYGTQTGIPATVGVFTLRPELVAGGISNHLMSTVDVAHGDLVDGFMFKKGQSITVTPKTGLPRQCRINSFIQSGPLWHIEVMDINQNA